eukprot:28630_1
MSQSVEDLKQQLLLQSIAKLKKKCKKMGLSKEGSKSDIIDRIIKKLHNASTDSANPYLDVQLMNDMKDFSAEQNKLYLHKHTAYKSQSNMVQSAAMISSKKPTTNYKKNKKDKQKHIIKNSPAQSYNDKEEKQTEATDEKIDQVHTQNAENIIKINITVDTNEHYWDERLKKEFVINVAYEQNETIKNIFEAIVTYVQNKSIVANVKVKIKTIAQESFLKPEMSWWQNQDQWDSYLNSIGNKPITDFAKQDIIKQGLKVQIKQHLELYTQLAKSRKEPNEKERVALEKKRLEWKKKEQEQLNNYNEISSWTFFTNIRIIDEQISEIEKNMVEIRVSTSNQFNAEFIIHASYEENEKLGNVLDQVIQYIENAHHPIKIKIDGQYVNGFTEGSIGGAHDFDTYVRWMREKSITEYTHSDIRKKGLRLRLKPHYIHNVISVELTCKHLKQLNSEDPLKCPFYYAMKKEYEFNKKNLIHLQSYTHFKNEYDEKPVCRHKDECKAYVRSENGENRLDDTCHMKLYRHPPRNRQIELSKNMHAFIVNRKEEDNQEVYWPTDDDEKKYNYTKRNGYLQALIEEVIDNGFKYVLGAQNQNGTYSLLKIVDEKMECVRHKAMCLPLNRAQMLALILYTGCDCNYDLCSSQRDGKYDKWKWFDYCLYKAIELLSERESGKFNVYRGLNNVKL